MLSMALWRCSVRVSSCGLSLEKLAWSTSGDSDLRLLAGGSDDASQPGSLLALPWPALAVASGGAPFSMRWYSSSSTAASSRISPLVASSTLVGSGAGLLPRGLPVTAPSAAPLPRASTFSRYVFLRGRRGQCGAAAGGLRSAVAGGGWSTVPFIWPVGWGGGGGRGGGSAALRAAGGGGGGWCTGSSAVLCTTLLSPASCLILSLRPMRLRAS